MKKLLIVVLVAAFYQSGHCQSATSSSDLFDSDEVLSVDLSFDINTVTNDIEVRDEHPAQLSYVASSGEKVNIDFKISVRGKTRANPKVCRFPPLSLNFKKKGNEGNLFEGLDKIKLVTHCQRPQGYDQYVINEFLIYKAYNQLTDKSFKVRLLRVNYVDAGGKSEPFERMGFLIEDIDDLADRHDVDELEKNLPNQDLCNREDLDIFTVFQFMIGNVDWSISSLHNTKLIGLEGEPSPSPIPYDFDYSGILASSYALPPENLPIENVKQRIFRGFCRKSGEYEKVFALFQEKRQSIYDTFLENELLSDKNKKRIGKYLDDFYKVLDDPRKSAREINGACRLNHEHLK